MTGWRRTKGGNQGRSFSILEGVISNRPKKTYGALARAHKKLTHIDTVWRGAKSAAVNRKRPITLASVPLRDLEDK